MRDPVEVALKYKKNTDASFSLLVDQIERGVYVWQYCKNGTADWNELENLRENMYFVSADKAIQRGDKYRCLIFVKGKVRFYSKVFTIKTEYEERKTSENNKQEGKKEYKKQSSQYFTIEDTDGMDGWQFERYCAEILKKNKFEDVKVTAGSGDFGIDILTTKDRITYAIQCKCYSQAVNNKSVQEAYSGKSFYKCMIAVVLTNNYFTESAKLTAAKNAVVLWDRDELIKLIAQANQFGKKQHTHNENDNYKESNETVNDLFAGCDTLEKGKERYRSLMRIYHPDEQGNENMTKEINRQYDEFKMNAKG